MSRIGTLQPTQRKRPTVKRFRHAVVSLALAALAVALPSAPQAAAASSYLCTGYTACAAAGYSHAGYPQVAKTRFWLMTGGHNCTNYVAYRMVTNQASKTRPWSSTGNAYNWGVANAAKTDLTPVVGAVAWWKANVKGAGSTGHVAYVEQVISADEIVVSEDNWGGSFDWRRIKRTSGWPSGFVHFKDAGVGSPRGRLDGATSTSSRQLSLKGWAFDPDATAKNVYIRVYVGGPAGVGQRLNFDAAKLSRPDVAKKYPGVGPNHGFDQTATVKASGAQPVYVYGLNKSTTPGKAALLGRAVVSIRA